QVPHHHEPLHDHEQEPDLPGLEPEAVTKVEIQEWNDEPGAEPDQERRKGELELKTPVDFQERAKLLQSERWAKVPPSRTGRRFGRTARGRPPRSPLTHHPERDGGSD